MLAGIIATRAKALFHRHLLWRLLSDAVVTPYLLLLAGLVLRVRRPQIVGVTGTVGKTTTTTAIAAVLTHPQARAIVGTVGQARDNMNNFRGLPLTVLQLDRHLPDDPVERLLALIRLPGRALRLAMASDYPHVLVLEMGTLGKGHLRRLANVARPDIGVITTVGAAHLETLGTIEGVAEEKAAIARATRPNGLVVLGAGHSHLDLLRRTANAPVVEVAGRGTDLADEIARVVGRRFGIPEAVIDAALAAAERPAGRLQMSRTSNLTVIDDSYNANPLSMKLGLDTLREGAGASRRVAVLGTMAELGDESARFHREIGDYARERCDMLIGVGDAARDYRPDHWFASPDACASVLRDLVRSGDHFLVKGSASANMSCIVEALRHLSATAHDLPESR